MAERRYWNSEIETMQVEELKKFQLGRLKKQLHYIYENSPFFYKKKFDEAGVHPGDIKTFDDFRNLPIFRTKEEDRLAQEESMERFGHPYGTYLCAPLEKVVHVYCTSGTSGQPSFYTYTENDMRVNDECWARTYWRAGIRPGDTVIHGFGLSVWSAGVPVVRALANMGCRPIACGAEAGTERMLMFANLTKPKALVGTPSLAEYLIEKCPQVLGKEVKELGIKSIVVAGAPGAGLPDVRKKIEEAFGAKLFDSSQGAWGLANVSCDSPEYQGLHVISEDFCIWYDIIDPDTKRAVPLENGAIGEGVITSFVQEAAPAVRYAFGDLIQVFTEPCPGCGFVGHRFKILSRVDDMLNVKGIKVYPAAVKNIVNSFVPRTSGEMRIVLDEPPPKVTPPLRMMVEHGANLSGDQLEMLRSELVERIQARLKFKPEIELVLPGTLERSTLKGKLIEKRYEPKQGT